MPQRYLLIVDANDQTSFKYTDFASGQDASVFQAQGGDSISWIVFSGASLVGYRIDFTKNGSPFQDKSIIQSAGGISPAQTVTNLTGSGLFYSVTLADLRMDDPQVVPYDSLMLRLLGVTRLAQPVPVTVGVNGQATTIYPNPAQFSPGALVYWNYGGTESFTIDFSAAGRTPFVDANSAKGPLREVSGKTSAEIVRKLTTGENPDFAYTATVNGHTVFNGTFTIS